MTANLYRIAIVGAAGLKGRELKEVLADRNFPAADVKLLDDDEGAGQLEAVGDEASFIQVLQPGEFAKIDFTFFASDEPFTRAHWKEAREAGSSIVDLSYALESEPGVAIRSPWVERELGQTQPAKLDSDVAVIAHPAAGVLALLLLRAGKFAKLERVVANVFEPASERGRRGTDELHQQTVNLLSFHEVPKQVFDTQVAFNMAAQYGPAASTSLHSVERRILRHYRQLTAGRMMAPSLMLLHSPIFHGHIFSIYIEMEREATAQEFGQALVGSHVSLVGGEEERPSNISAAGEENILVSVRAEPERKNAMWLWAAIDNLRLAALTAVDCAASLALTRSQGPVQ